MCALALWAALAPAAQASDRPFLATTSAAAEEDDDNVWSVESAFMRRGGARTWSIAPEYAFDPTTSVQVELARARDRSAGETEREVEIEFKQLFNHIARDGWGLGASVSLGWQKGDGGWRRGGALTLPFSWQFAEGAALLHLNGGVEKEPGVRRAWTRSVALAGEVMRRTTLFGEAARAGAERLVHAGVRWWAQREKVALDLSWHRVRGADGRAGGVVLGVGFYDL